MKYLRDDQMLYFMHLHKTAGTSVHEFIKLNLELDSDFFNKGYHADQKLFFKDFGDKINDFKYLGGHYNWLLADQIEKPMLSFVIMRDPIERTISHYKHSMRNFEIPQFANVTSKQLKIYKDMPFEEYIRSDVILRTRIANAQTRQIASSNMIVFNQGGSMEDCLDPKHLEEAKRRVDSFTFVGMQKDMYKTMLQICYHCGWKPRKQMTRYNTGSKKFTKDDLSQETLDFLHKHLELDYELFDYIEKRFDEETKDITYEKVLQNYNEVMAERFVIEDIDNIPKGYVKYDAGFHSLENNRFRWTGPVPESEISFCLKDKCAINFEFKAVATMDSKITKSMRIFVNDVEAKYKRSVHTFSVDVSEEIMKSSEITTIRLVFDKTMSPKEKDKNSQDERKLGVALTPIKIKKLGK